MTKCFFALAKKPLMIDPIEKGTKKGNNKSLNTSLNVLRLFTM